MIRSSRTIRLSVSVGTLFLAAVSILSAAWAGDYWEPKNYAPVTDPAKQKQIHNDGAAIWREGNELYKAGDYKKALEVFERSIVKYQILRLTNDIEIVTRAIKASACMDRLNSTDINQLKELIGENEDKTSGATTPYPNSCLPFSDLAAHVQKRIAALQKTSR
ncbi:hypothetical protein JQ599_32450 [Bradyrhizobium diazoefficiens]|nr:hypothetical protein [Bradyrhizobium diazoefficiens]MBR0704654.1 hypothetical protein [Bradyrhizobium diazoefficiens]MBR0772984.1 hypothetical protein [Bradyrhizobium diazoefficiens]